jgi:hypothetical protein
MIVDTATREGMSGAPVIARRSGGFHKSDGMITIAGGRGTKLVGIYSGRLPSNDQFGAQLGYVWPARYIEEIAQNGVRDVLTD